MNLNRIFILGNVVAPPEARMTTSGQTVASFRVATNRVWKDQAGNKQEAAEFHSVVAWGRLAEIARQYLTKGQLILVEGRIQTRSWQAPDGQKKYRTEIVAQNFQMGPRSDRSGMNATNAPPKTNSSASQNEEIPVIEEDAPLSLDEDKNEEIKPEDIPF